MAVACVGLLGLVLFALGCLVRLSVLSAEEERDEAVLTLVARVLRKAAGE